jgi:hypothetical protein
MRTHARETYNLVGRIGVTQLLQEPVVELPRLRSRHRSVKVRFRALADLSRHSETKNAEKLSEANVGL